MLLYATFVQVPLLHVRDVFRDRRFVLASLIGNFVLIPLAIWLMLQWLPGDPVLRLGVLLVLLAPCTDWFITFTQLGCGNTARAIAVTPLNLLAQLLLLPFYLWLMLPVVDFNVALQIEDMLPTALVLIGVPLLAAAFTEYWIETKLGRSVWREQLGWWSVSLLAAALIARLLTRMLRLPMNSGRTLALNFGTRNSFVVLPFALALPAGWEMTAVIIVFQSLVELFGMVFYLWWLPDRVFKETSVAVIERDCS